MFPILIIESLPYNYYWCFPLPCSPHSLQCHFPTLYTCHTTTIIFPTCTIPHLHIPHTHLTTSIILPTTTIKYLLFSMLTTLLLAYLHTHNTTTKTLQIITIWPLSYSPNSLFHCNNFLLHTYPCHPNHIFHTLNTLNTHYTTITILY